MLAVPPIHTSTTPPPLLAPSPKAVPELRLLRLLRARPTALGGLALPPCMGMGRDRAAGRPQPHSRRLLYTAFDLPGRRGPTDLKGQVKQR